MPTPPIRYDWKEMVDHEMMVDHENLLPSSLSFTQKIVDNRIKK